MASSKKTTSKTAARNSRMANNSRNKSKKRNDAYTSERKQKEQMQRAAHCLGIVCILCFALVGIRLVQYQIIQARGLSEEGASRRSNVIKVQPRRGTIYDRNGHILAKSVDCKTIYANPKEVTDPQKVAQIIAEELNDADNQDTYEELLKKKTTFVYIKRQVDLNVAQKIKQRLEKENLPGIYMLEDTKRIYPYGDVAMQILGRVDTDGNGISGIEKYYDQDLRGVAGEKTFEAGPQGEPIAGAMVKDVAAQNGKDITLSIDEKAQSDLEVQLAGITEVYGAKSSMAAVMDPETGEIVACASTPLYDSSDPKPEGLNLSLVSSSYEPGSTMKIATMATAFETGAVTPETSFTVPGSIKVGNHIIRDADKHSQTIEMNPEYILAHSSNLGSIMVMEKMGLDAFYSGIKKLHIGDKTGIDYPGEIAGIFPKKEDFTLDTAKISSFGQSLSVPPIQTLRLLGAIANDGTMNTPHFATQIGTAKTQFSQENVISQETIGNLVPDLRAVVKLHKNVEVAGYAIAGKSGTAQEVINGKYSDQNFNSFVGFNTQGSKRYVGFIGLAGVHGLSSSNALPAFSQIMTIMYKDLGVAAGPSQGN